MTEVVIVIIGVVVFLAMLAFADGVTEKDREEREKDESE